MKWLRYNNNTMNSLVNQSYISASSLDENIARINIEDDSEKLGEIISNILDKDISIIKRMIVAELQREEAELYIDNIHIDTNKSASYIDEIMTIVDESLQSPISSISKSDIYSYTRDQLVKYCEVQKIKIKKSMTKDNIINIILYDGCELHDSSIFKLKYQFDTEEVSMLTLSEIKKLCIKCGKSITAVVTKAYCLNLLCNNPVMYEMAYKDIKSETTEKLRNLCILNGFTKAISTKSQEALVFSLLNIIKINDIK